MYRLIEPSAFFNDDLLCGVSEGKESKETIEIDEQIVFSISPNPANEQINLQITPQRLDLTVDLRSITGQSMRTFVIPAEQTHLRMNTVALPAGIYYISVSDTERLLETKRVVIIH